jgi:ABC-2 type transport system permease protein
VAERQTVQKKPEEVDEMNIIRWVPEIFTITEFELRKLRHDFSQVFMRVVQPTLWLLVFGEVFTKTRVLSTGKYTYLQFLTPGVLAQSVIFVAIFYGLTLVWERDLGLLHKLLSTPAPRYTIIMGKALSAGVRSIIQAVVVFILAVIIGVHLNFNAFTVLGVTVVIVLCGMCFSSLSMLLAALMKTRERMMGMGQAITMPVFFASSAIYPADIMPQWLRIIVRFNPLSYVVDAMRSMLVTGNLSNLPADMGAIVLATVLLLGLASMTVSRIIR